MAVRSAMTFCWNRGIRSWRLPRVHKDADRLSVGNVE